MGLAILSENQTVDGPSTEVAQLKGGTQYLIVEGNLGGGSIAIGMKTPDEGLVEITPFADVTVEGATAFEAVEGMIIASNLSGSTGANVNIWVTT